MQVSRLCLPLLILTLLCPALSAQPGPEARVNQLIERVAARPDRAWDYAYSLRSLTRGEDGRKTLPLIEKGLDHDSEAVRLVCARILMVAGNPDVALETLGKLLASDDDAILEATALLIADEAPDDEDLTEKLRDAWQESGRRAAGTRVALCEALYMLTADMLPIEQLREFTTTGNHELVARAAITLTELGQNTGMEGRVATIAREPGDLGRLARLGSEVLRIDQAVDDHRTGRIARPPEALVVSTIRALRAHYVDDHFYHGEMRQQLTPPDLVDNACRAMSVAVDRYGAFLTPQEIAAMNEDQQGSYVGIGAHVATDDDNIIYITQPVYEGPAYKAGIRSGDKLVGILDPDGKRIDLTKIALEDGVKLVRGPEGTTATVFVRRRGVEGELKFEIKRQTVQIDTALEEMLPGRVGYVRLTRFGGNSAKEMAESLANLSRMGMESLILDLRGNGGGQLDAVVQIADMFLPRGKVISSTGGRHGPWAGRQPPMRSKGGPYTEIPMVVLIDTESASGSEMLSGALKDNDRAILIGRQTFGKGIGQGFESLKSDRTRMLKATVFKYYLPGGKCPDRDGDGGVTPHIQIDPQYLETWQVYAIQQLRRSGKYDEYLDIHYRGEGKAALMELAAFDGLDTTAWPQFEKFYQSLGTQLGPDHVRRELRFALRTRVQDDRGSEFTQNFQEDRGILRGVKELFAKAAKDPKEIEPYRKVMDRE